MTSLKKYISSEAETKLNELLREFFKMNSFCDNVAYWFAANRYYHASKIYHEEMAHKWPEIADELTGVMDKLGARAVRLGFEGDAKEYNSPTEALAETVQMIEWIRGRVLGTLEELDFSIQNKEIQLKLEDICQEVLDLLYKANLWYDYMSQYDAKGQGYKGDLKFDDFADFD